MATQTVSTLLNPQNGNLAFKLFSFEDNSYFDHVQRNNYYSLIWLRRGNGTVTADFSAYEFDEGALFSFSPYQPFMIASRQQIGGVALQFHPDFFCIHKHQAEIACNGVLFNNIYAPPFVKIDENSATKLTLLMDQMRSEMQHPALAQYELLISYLKILLITLSRLKSEQEPHILPAAGKSAEPFVFQKLKNTIEKDFRTKHTASDYAKSLNVSTKSLAKITKTHFNKTLTELISERIIIEAKRELYLTNKAVKEIAFELGYQDEYYFSRFFKTNAGISPQMYRDTVGFGRGA